MEVILDLYTKMMYTSLFIYLLFNNTLQREYIDQPDATSLTTMVATPTT
jgi:hypothetical protein